MLPTGATMTFFGLAKVEVGVIVFETIDGVYLFIETLH